MYTGNLKVHLASVGSFIHRINLWMAVISVFIGSLWALSLDFIKVYLDFRNTSCVLTEFGSYAAHNMFP